MIILKIIIIVLLMLSTANISAKSSENIKISAKVCSGISSKIKQLNSKLRAGYKVEKGERLKKKLRSTKNKRFLCKQQGFATNR